jgi:protein involved in polysaccharide export with SLBB domain
MVNYVVHPDCYYGIELRAGESVDDYIATARGFNTTAEFREYRDATPTRKAEIREQRDKSADSSDEDRKRQLELLRLTND